MKYYTFKVKQTQTSRIRETFNEEHCGETYEECRDHLLENLNRYGIRGNSGFQIVGWETDENGVPLEGIV